MVRMISEPMSHLYKLRLTKLLVVLVALAASASPPAGAVAPILADPHDAGSGMDCYLAVGWDALTSHDGQVACSDDGDAVRLSATGQYASPCSSGGSGHAALRSTGSFGPGAVFTTRAAGGDLYGTSAGFGFSDWGATCTDGQNLWDGASGIFVTTNAFPPERDTTSVGFRVVQDGVLLGSSVVTVANDDQMHDYAIAWGVAQAVLYVDGEEAASLPAPALTLLPVVLSATAWASTSETSWLEVESTVAVG